MKKSIPRKLSVRQETLRALVAPNLGEVRGGVVSSNDILNTCPAALVATSPCANG